MFGYFVRVKSQSLRRGAGFERTGRKRSMQDISDEEAG
jgi:hypothetical protein